MSKVLVIGGGAAGMMAAIAAAENGHEVCLYEKNEKLGKKIFITGKGRCNLTNDCETAELFSHIVTNAKFLYSAIYSYDNYMVEEFMKSCGCPIKVERGKRVFPVSDHAYDVINACVDRMKSLGVKIYLNSHVDRLLCDQNDGGKKIRGAVIDGKKVYSDAVILATGGYSYPSTGSTGEGHGMAEAVGHTIRECRPALVPFVASEEWIKELQGLALKNCGVRICDGDRLIYEDFGELLFTHFGVSGPTVLSASSYCVELIRKKPLTLHLDLKPALTSEQLDERILRDFEANANKNFNHSLNDLLPKSMIPVIVELSGIDPEKKVHDIRREERQRLVSLLKDLEITLTGLRGFEEAIITHGGVNVKEVDPSTMESRIVGNLYFAGELLDVDAVTGGFNLQIAWSTGHLAGSSIEG